MTELRLTGLRRGTKTVSLEEMAALRADGAEAHTAVSGRNGEEVPIAAIIDLADPEAGAAFCTVVSTDGSYRASIPLQDLRESGRLAFRLGRDPLPADRGGPLRLTVAEGKTLCWNVKDVGELRFTAAKEPDSVPARPKH